MAKLGSALLGFCAAAALVGCGGSDSTRSDPLDGADWTLTIVSPSHGDEVSTLAEVEVAISGDAVARGDNPSFDIGFFVDGELVHQTSDTTAMIALPIGSHALGVEGVDRDGGVLEDVLGDEILLDIRNPFGRDLVIPNVPELQMPGLAPSVRLASPHLPTIPNVELEDVPEPSL
jgi:hypothetical protein